jgi:hypothetical protein
MIANNPSDATIIPPSIVLRLVNGAKKRSSIKHPIPALAVKVSIPADHHPKPPCVTRDRKRNAEMINELP